MVLTSQDFLKLSSATAGLYVPCGLAELPGKAIAVARELLDCDHLSYNELGDGHFLGIVDPVIDSELNETFARLSSQHPSIIYLREAEREMSVKISDFVSQPEWRRSPLFNEFFCKLDLNYQMAFLFSAGKIQIGMAANRGSKDFSERERLILTSLRAHLRQAHENARAYERTRWAMDQHGFGTVVLNGCGAVLICSPRAQRSIELFFGPIRHNSLPEEIHRWVMRALESPEGDAAVTAILRPCIKETEAGRLIIRISPNDETGEHLLTTEEHARELPVAVFRKFGHSTREAEVLAWIAQGKTNPEIAVILDISAKTVAHHVERILSRLGVEGRGSAGAWAQETLRNEQMAYHLPVARELVS